MKLNNFKQINEIDKVIIIIEYSLNYSRKLT